MIKVVQFGEGNFLRTFVDLYFDTLNKEGGDYKVNIVKPITFGTLDKFKAQNNVYHIVLRGVANGNPVEDVYKVDVLEDVIDPFNDIEKYQALAKEDELKILNNLVSGYFDFAEIQAMKHRPMYMSDYIQNLDNILSSTGEPLLVGAGKVSHTAAISKAEKEYRKYELRTLSPVEEAYLDTIKQINKEAKDKNKK